MNNINSPINIIILGSGFAAIEVLKKYRNLTRLSITCISK